MSFDGRVKLGQTILVDFSAQQLFINIDIYGLARTN